jgi:hypothetical protein
MGKLFRNIIGLAFVAASVAMAGVDRQSQQLHCQKVAPQVANCRAEIKTLAGWGGRVEDFADVRSARVALVNATRRSWNKQSGYSPEKPTGERYYPVFLVARSGKQSRLVYSNYEAISNDVADQVNQFLKSGKPTTTIDLSAVSGSIPHGAWIFAGLFGGMGLVLLGWPWVVSRLWPWWQMRRMNPQLRSMLESDRGL